MFHATASRFTAAQTQASAKGAFGQAWGWTRVGREALGLLARPLLRPGQGIDGLEVSDSSFEEWEAVQQQFEARVSAGSMPLL